jgi:hypothetical protein
MTQQTQQVTVRTVNYKDLVQKAAGKDWKKPEVVYQFSGGRKFESTDDKETGIYRQS